MSIVIPLGMEVRKKLYELLEHFPEHPQDPAAAARAGQIETRFRQAITKLIGYYDGNKFSEPEGFRSTEEASDFLNALLNALGKPTIRTNYYIDRAITNALEANERLDFTDAIQNITASCKQLSMNLSVQSPRRARH